MKQIAINWRDSYQLINFIFLIIILLIFFYSLLFSPDTNNYPVKSEYTLITGNTSLSSGLSHGFSCMIRGRFQEARQHNIYSAQLFFFFILQFAMRGILLFYLVYTNNDEKKLAAPVDAIISTGLFILFFYPFLKDLFK